MLSIKRTTSENEDFIFLITQLDAYLSIIDGDEHAFYAQYNTIDTLRNTVVCYENESAVGCGAFKEFDNNTVEIKRMYVLPEFRGKGIAGAILKDLEDWAAEFNYTTTILETGKKQTDAIRLYQKSGYEVIPNYGQYENVENSICMKKTIRKSSVSFPQKRES